MKKLVGSGFLVLLVALVAPGFGVAATEESDAYWELSKQVDISSDKPPNYYWRTHFTKGEGNDSGAVEIFDACTDTKVANATGDIKQWNLNKMVEGNQQGNSDEQGNIEIILENGKLHAKGHRIEKLKCDEKGKPIGPIVLMVPPISKKTTDLSSGAAHLLAAVGKTLYVTRPITPTISKPNITETKVKAQTLVCKSAPMTQEAVRTLTDNPILTQNPQFYPGNIVQGKKLTETSMATFVPIGIKRAKGRITIRGLNFADADAKLSIEVDEVREGNIEEARQKLLSQTISGTEALATFDTMQVYSNEQMMFALGVDGRYGPASFNTKMQIDTKSKKNYVLARFQQVYYTINFEDPDSPFDVFAEGENFKDPFNRIGPDNPPLFFKQVGYGRAIYFLASSTESATNVKAAMEGAYGNKDAGNYIGLTGETDFKSVMANTSISYFAMGGDSVTALQPIKEATPEKMFEAIKKIIADAKVAKVSEVSRGLPLTYSLSYVTSLSPASMGYSTTYDQTDCTLLGGDKYSFSIEHYCVDDYVDVFVDQGMGGGPVVVKHLSNAGDTPITNLDNDIPSSGKKTTVTIKETNVAGPWCASFRIKRVHVDPKTERADVVYLKRNNTAMPSEPLDYEEAKDDLKALQDKSLTPKKREILLAGLVRTVGRGRDANVDSELDNLEPARKKLVERLEKFRKLADEEPVSDADMKELFALLDQAKGYEDSVFGQTYFNYGVGGNWNVGSNLQFTVDFNRGTGNMNITHD